MPRVIHHFRQETDLFTKQKLRTYKFLSIIAFKISTIPVYLPKNEAAKAREHEFPFGTFRLRNLFRRTCRLHGAEKFPLERPEKPCLIYFATEIPGNFCEWLIISLALSFQGSDNGRVV